MSVLFILVLLAILILAFAGGKNAWGQSEIICPNPNCGYRGPGAPDGGTSGCLLIILLLLGVLPGILYLLFAGRPGLKCPKCGVKIR